MFSYLFQSNFIRVRKQTELQLEILMMSQALSRTLKQNIRWFNHEIMNVILCMWCPVSSSNVRKCYVYDVPHGWQSNNTIYQSVRYPPDITIRFLYSILYLLYYRMYDDVTWFIFLRKPMTFKFRMILNDQWILCKRIAQLHSSTALN